MIEAPRHLSHLHHFYCMLCKEYLGSTGDNGFYTGIVTCRCGARNRFHDSIAPVGVEVPVAAPGREKEGRND